MTSLEFSDETIRGEMARLEAGGLGAFCEKTDLRETAALTLRINALKKSKNAVIAVHVYQRPEIIAGIADFVGDSYKLAKDCVGADASVIVFCGVKFMAETAKILSPQKTVLLPSPDAGCTLADSITAGDVLLLKKQYPGVPVVTYINTSVEVKAESDCIVTSANAEKILRKYFESNKRVIFLPDRLMGANLAKTLGKKIGEELILWRGTCVVHEHFDPLAIAVYRRRYPGIKILAHGECAPELVAKVDFVGGTSDMLRFIEKNDAPFYLLITECGLGELAAMRFPDKKFIAMCRLCPYMKLTTLESILAVLENPQPSQITEVPAGKINSALTSLNKMFELAG